MEKKALTENKPTIPGWFIWTTTIGLAAVIVLLFLSYSATANLARANYALMQGSSNMNMMNSGMMQMMSRAMMRSGMMTSQEYDAVTKAYEANADARQKTGGMMADGVVSDAEYQGMMANQETVQGMMGR